MMIRAARPSTNGHPAPRLDVLARAVGRPPEVDVVSLARVSRNVTRLSHLQTAERVAVAHVVRCLYEDCRVVDASAWGPDGENALVLVRVKDYCGKPFEFAVAVKAGKLYRDDVPRNEYFEVKGGKR